MSIPEITVTIADEVPLMRLAEALAIAGLVIRNDNGALRLEPASADATRGIAWYNGLSRAERGYWLDAAGSAVPADAWRAYKAARLT